MWSLLSSGLFIQTRPHYIDMYVQLGHEQVASLSMYMILDQNHNIKELQLCYFHPYSNPIETIIHMFFIIVINI